MKKIKQEKGITLVALIITIIVLVILAGVSIANLMGQNGMLTDIQISTMKYESAAIKEEIELTMQGILLENIFEKNLTTSQMAKYLSEKLPGIMIIETTDDKIKVGYKGYKIEIESNWKVKIVENAGINVLYKLEPEEGYTKDSVIITLDIQTRDGISVKSVVTQDEGISTIEENKKYKVTENKVYEFVIIYNKNNNLKIEVPVESIDKEAPNAEIGLITKEEIINENTKIKAKAIITDEKSGVDFEKCKWVLKENNDPIGTNIENYTGGNISSEDGNIETGIITEPNKYFIHVLVTDKIGNVKEYCSDEILIISPPVINGELTVKANEIDVAITLEAKEETKVIYTIEKAGENKVLQTSNEIKDLKYTFLGLAANQEYKIIIQATNKYGTTSKTKNVTTGSIKSNPILTANNASIIYDGFAENSVSYYTSKYFYAFDNSESTGVWTYPNKLGDATIGCYIGYDFGIPVEITKVSGRIRMTSYKIQYSDDLKSWHDVFTGKSTRKRWWRCD